MTGTDLKFHPLADMFPLMEGDEFDALVADIKANGVREPITIFEGKILDGRNRYRACVLLGIEPRFQEHRAGCAHVGDPAAYVISMNIHRRHLTAEQKRDLIAKLIEAQPEKSDRQIAKQAKASPTTVGTTRAKMEKTGEVSKLDTRTDAKGVKQPAKKKRSADAEQEEADKKECTRLWQKVQQAEKEATGDSTVDTSIDTKGRKQPAKKKRKPKLREPTSAGAVALEREFEETVAPPVILEKLRAAEIKIEGLQSEIEDLKRERANLQDENAALRAEIAELRCADAGIPDFLRRSPGAAAS